MLERALDFRAYRDLEISDVRGNIRALILRIGLFGVPYYTYSIMDTKILF